MLAPGGTALICTENLASWHNVAALALGMQPFSCTNISKKGAEAHGFTIKAVFASGYYPAVGRAATALARCDPRHAHFIGIVAQ